MNRIVEYLRDDEHAAQLGYAMGQTAHQCQGFTGARVCRYRDEPRRSQIGMAGHEEAFRKAWWQGLQNPSLESDKLQRLKPKQQELAL